MSNNNNNSSSNTNDNATPWVDANLVFLIEDTLAIRGINKTMESIRRMAYDLSAELVEIMWNSVPIAARAELVHRTYAHLAAIGKAPEELNSIWMMHEAVERVVTADAPWMFTERFKSAVHNKALKAPARFIAEHHESFVDPVSSYATASKYTELKDRKVLVLAHILGVLA